MHLIRDGDVAPSIAAGQGGTGRGHALRASAGRPRASSPPRRSSASAAAIQGKLWPRNDEERQALVDAGIDPDRVLKTDDLVSGDDCFVAATGVTTGSLLRGVSYRKDSVVTHSIVMRSRSGTVRMVEARHELSKLRRLSAR